MIKFLKIILKDIVSIPKEVLFSIFAATCMLVGCSTMPHHPQAGLIVTQLPIIILFTAITVMYFKDVSRRSKDD